jgi:hypothetical protein
MHKKVPYRTIDMWTHENQYIIIKNNNSRVVMNPKQSLIWELIDGILTVKEIAQNFEQNLNSDIDYDFVLRFILMAKSIGIIDFVDEEWEI